MKAIRQFAYLLIGAICAPSAVAALVTHTYTGTINDSRGNHAAEAPIGSTIILTYTVDTSTTDEHSSPDQGIFFGALQSLRVELPGRNLIFLVTGGTVQTGDNGVLMGERLADQVIMHGGEIDESSQFGGLPVFNWQLVFEEVTPFGETPTMLDGDAFPTDPIAAQQVFLELQTVVGVITTLRFQPEPSQPTIAEVAADAKLRIDELVEQGQLGAGVARSLVAKLNAVLAASSAQKNGVCGPLAGLRNQVGNMPRRNSAEVAVADELAALITTLTESAGGCGAPT